MSKLVYIFTRLPNAYAPKRLIEEIEKIGHKGRIIDYSQVVFNVEEGKLQILVQNEVLPLPNAVVFRAPGIDGFCSAVRDGLLNYFLQNNVRCLNSENFTTWSTWDKLTQHIEFTKANIPCVNTKIFADLNLLKETVTTFPVIAKSYLGTHGDNVKKIKTSEDFVQLEQKDAPFLVQPFLTSGRDVRVIVLGTKALGAMLRTAQDGAYLTNYSAGGAIELFDLDKNPEVAEIAEKTAKHFKCEYAGVDLMQDEAGSWKVLEINRSCQFEGFEQATGDNVAQKLLKYLLQ